MLIFVTFAVIIMDQASKFLVQSRMAELESIPIVLNIFHITYVNNPGAAFSILRGRAPVFIVITLLALALSLYFFYRIDRERIWLRLGIALEMGGAVGNMIDRLRFGEVVDFFDFRIWPVFNVADCAVVVGVALICWELLREDMAGRKQGS